jgi:hypothetical protein
MCLYVHIPFVLVDVHIINQLGKCHNQAENDENDKNLDLCEDAKCERMRALQFK